MLDALCSFVIHIYPKFALCFYLGRGQMKSMPHPLSASLKSLLPQTSEDPECMDFDQNNLCFKAGLYSQANSLLTSNELHIDVHVIPLQSAMSMYW